MPESVVFRPRGGVVLAGIAIAVCATGLVFIGVTEGVAGLFAWSLPLLAIAWSAWLLYIDPFVRVTAGFLEIRNPLRTHRVPWDDVAEVDSRYALTVTTRAGRRIRAWAAPAPGARRALSIRREEVSRQSGDGDTRRPSDAEGTESGDASDLVRRALAAHRADPVAAQGETRSDWRVWHIAVTALVWAAAIASLVPAAQG